jgi:hypothetical protein
MEASKCLLIALVLAICASIFQLIGLASPYWSYLDTQFGNINGGLWKYCSDNAMGTRICIDFPIVTGTEHTSTCTHHHTLLKVRIFILVKEQIYVP